MLLIYFIFLASTLLSILLLVRFCAAVFSLRSREAILRHPIVHLLLFAFVIFVWFVPWPSRLGHFVAQYDVSRRHLEIKKYGLHRGSLAIYSSILKERYNVICPTSACCAIMQSEVEYSNAYNAVSIPEIIQYFGKDIFAECEEAAKSESAIQQSAKPKEVLKR